MQKNPATRRRKPLVIAASDAGQRLFERASRARDEGKLAKAERLYRRSLAWRKRVLGPEQPEVAQSMNHLANLLPDQGRHAEAEPPHL